ncbi:MAG: pyruvate dehydrogenase complex E1 component subunit beta [Pseudomonadota bacterium]|nr:pyruvate dehydrogenase complex E1 component subunit beta [Pseudomonadota bacterium]
MPTKILMPALSPTMEEGTLSKWLVKKGEKVKAGDVLAEIETDKATMEFEVSDDGTVLELLYKEGTEGIRINSPIALITLEDEKIRTTTEEASLTEELSEEMPPKHPEHALTSLKKGKSKDKFNQNAIEQSVREAIRDAIAEEMRLDDNVFLMGEEVADYQGAYKVSQGLVEEFGKRRVIDTPITEHGFSGLAIGAAFSGLRPIVEFMTFNFSMQAMDQIVNSAAKTLYMSGGQMGCPIVFRGPNGAAARVAAQHSQDFSSWYSSIPGLKVVSPYSAADAKGLLKSAIRDQNPVIFLENELLYGEVFEVQTEECLVPIGEANIIQEGSDISLISFGIGVKYAIQTAGELQKQGISAEIIDLRSLRPLDKRKIIESVKKTNRCVTIEQGFPVCSIGNHVSQVIMENAFDYLDAPVINCTGKDVPMPYAANLEAEALITVDYIMNRINEQIF